MSEKNQLRWESPFDIYVPHELNNRSLDVGYVESLEDSMRTQGYLPTYPIICYRRMEMPKEVFDGKTDALYICAAGFHRTTAAQNIVNGHRSSEERSSVIGHRSSVRGISEIADTSRVSPIPKTENRKPRTYPSENREPKTENPFKVYVEIRSGTFEDYLETLHTDNFQFDPSVDTSLGQIWTKTEKRKACKQLLLLPKYFKLANVALAELWHTSEANVRRWRDEVASSIDDGSLEAPFPLSEEWRSDLKNILDSNVREMNDGSVVKIRSKSDKDDGKWDFYWALQEKVKDMKSLDWNTQIEAYCETVYEKEASDLSFKKLAELDQLISTKDPEFMKTCRKLGGQKKKLNAARDACHDAYQEAKAAFDTYVFGQDLAESRYGEKYGNCLKSFGRAVSRTFGHNLIGSRLYTDKVSKYENETAQLQELKKSIESDSEFVRAWAKRQVNAQRKKREQLGQAVIDAHYKMLTAVQEKYAGIDLDKFCFSVDADCSLWLAAGDTPTKPMHSTQDIPDGKSDGELIRIAEHYEKMLEKIEKGPDWIKRLVIDEMKPSSADAAFKKQRVDWGRIKSSMAVINSELAKHTYTDRELEVIDSLSDQIIEWLKPYQFTTDDQIAILTKIMWNLMEREQN